jgi:pseudouridine-5'-phosphate glycosidase
MTGAEPWARVGDPVARVLQFGQPVVALETAVVTHGLPKGRVPELIARLDAAVRQGGALPAFVGLVAGEVVIGMTAAELDALLVHDAAKVAERDLAAAVALRRYGGTTVSATIAVAHAHGIPVAATGGIGGVHYGAERTGDVSADVAALSRFPVALVCAGAKAICDPGRTVEALDSLGVTVVGYRTGEMPAFLAASSGLSVPLRLDTADGIARLLAVKRRLGQPQALLVVQAPPPDAALDGAELQDAVRAALARAETAAVHAGEVTPFLLSAIATATAGRSVETNLAVLEANARLAGSIAAALAAQRETSAGR